jgi:hypothetical protein
MSGEQTVVLLFLNLCTRGVVSLTLRLMYSWGNNLRYPLNGRLGEPLRRFDLFGEGKSFLASGRI